VTIVNNACLLLLGSGARAESEVVLRHSVLNSSDESLVAATSGAGNVFGTTPVIGIMTLDMDISKAGDAGSSARQVSPCLADSYCFEFSVQ